MNLSYNSGTNSSKDDPAGQDERDVGDAAELPSRCVVDARTGEDLWKLCTGEHELRLQTLADELPVQQSKMFTLLTK